MNDKAALELIEVEELESKTAPDYSGIAALD